METNQSIAKKYEQFVLSTYGREGLTIVRGEGSYLYDSEGTRYLDLYPGWGTVCLGHCHPYIVEQVAQQLKTLIHVPNNYYNPWQAQLAEKLAGLGFFGYTFFCNSGAEANEAAIKLARRFGNQSGGRYEIITFYKSFHGRTLAAITATGQEKYQKGLAPLPQGFVYARFGDIESVKSVITPKTCAVMFELIQGEGGVNCADPSFFTQLETMCKEKNILLIIDEVQTGLGRTGDYYGFQTFGITPHVVTLAKALGGGFAIGAMMAKPELKDMLPPGMHASTYGGNPVACCAGLAVIEVLEREGVLENVKKQSAFAFERLEQIKARTGRISQIRGKGLMIGVDTTVPALSLKQYCRGKKVLINNVGENTVRFLPALNITSEDLAKGLDIFEEALKAEGSTS